MLIPRKVKYRKRQKGRSMWKGVATRATDLDFGSYGLKTIEHGWLTSRQIESARRAMTRFIKRGGKIWIRVYPDKPVTVKGEQMPMGKGKGAPDHYVAVVKPGTMLFEMEGVTHEQAKEALRLASHKLPVKTKYITK